MNKSQYKVLKTLSHSGESFKPGHVIEMDDETARAFGADYVERADAPATAGDSVKPEASNQPAESQSEQEKQNKDEND